MMMIVRICFICFTRLLIVELSEHRHTAVIINISIVNRHKQQVRFHLIIQNKTLFEVNIQ